MIDFMELFSGWNVQTRITSAESFYIKNYKHGGYISAVRTYPGGELSYSVPNGQSAMDEYHGTDEEFAATISDVVELMEDL